MIQELNEIHQVEILIRKEIDKANLNTRMKVSIMKVVMSAFEKGRNFQRDGHIKVDIQL